MLQVGDKVDMHDGSYCFGIKDGGYTSYCDRETDRKSLTVVQINLSTMECADGTRNGDYTQVCDILVTNNNGDFWFTQSRFVKPAAHTITIDGKDIVISDESFANLKKQFCE